MKCREMETKEPIDQLPQKMKKLVIRGIHYQIVFAETTRLWRHIPEQ